MHTKDKDIIQSYYDPPKEDPRKQATNEKKEVEIRVLNDTNDEKITALLGCFFLNFTKNPLSIDFFSEHFNVLVNNFKKKIHNVEQEMFEVEGVSKIKLHSQDPLGLKTTIKTLVRIVETEFVDDEFTNFPFDVVFGDFSVLEEFMVKRELIPFTHKSNIVKWKYKYQPELVGDVKDFIVVTESGQLEIVNGCNPLIENYRFPDLYDLFGSPL